MPPKNGIVIKIPTNGVATIDSVRWSDRKSGHSGFTGDIWSSQAACGNSCSAEIPSCQDFYSRKNTLSCSLWKSHAAFRTRIPAPVDGRPWIMFRSATECPERFKPVVSGLNQVPGSLMSDFGLSPVLPALPDGWVKKCNSYQRYLRKFLHCKASAFQVPSFF